MLYVLDAATALQAITLGSAELVGRGVLVAAAATAAAAAEAVEKLLRHFDLRLALSCIL